MKKIADMLTTESVSILTIYDDETRYRCAYVNSDSGRILLLNNEPENISSEVLEVWGDIPTVQEPELPENDPMLDTWDEMANAIREGVDEV